MTPAERKTRFREIQSALSPLNEQRRDLQIELIELTPQIAVDDVVEAFPGIVVKECFFPQIDNRTPETSTQHIVTMLKNQNLTPRECFVDRVRGTITFAK